MIKTKNRRNLKIKNLEMDTVILNSSIEKIKEYGLYINNINEDMLDTINVYTLNYFPVLDRTYTQKVKELCKQVKKEDRQVLKFSIYRALAGARKYPSETKTFFNRRKSSLEQKILSDNVYNTEVADAIINQWDTETKQEFVQHMLPGHARTASRLAEKYKSSLRVQHNLNGNADKDTLEALALNRMCPQASEGWLRYHTKKNQTPKTDL